MARITNEKDRASRRSDILNAAERLIFTQGYEQMTIQAILDALGISKGAFYHYFDSKTTVLEALVERMAVNAEGTLNPILSDPALSGIEKLRQYFASGVRWKTARITELMPILRAVYTDDNLVFRQKLIARLVSRGAGMLEGVIAQGVAEGALRTPYPAQIGEVVMLLLQNLGEMLAAEVLAAAGGTADPARIQRRVDVYTGAVERVLGASPGALPIVDANMIAAWFSPDAPAAPMKRGKKVNA